VRRLERRLASRRTEATLIAPTCCGELDRAQPVVKPITVCARPRDTRSWTGLGVPEYSNAGRSAAHQPDLSADD
jgi:hypothetical protein